MNLKKIMFIGTTSLVATPMFGWVRWGLVEQEYTEEGGQPRMIVRAVQPTTENGSIQQINFADPRFSEMGWLKCHSERIDHAKAWEIAKNCWVLEQVELINCYVSHSALQCFENAGHIVIKMTGCSNNDDESDDEDTPSQYDNSSSFHP